jgi:hypothetical protein
VYKVVAEAEQVVQVQPWRQEWELHQASLTPLSNMVVVVQETMEPLQEQVDQVQELITSHQ